MASNHVKLKAKSSREIARALTDDRKINAAMKSAAKAAIRQHKLLGKPIAVARNGKVVWIHPD